MIFLAILFYAYCFIGAAIGVICFLGGDWPVKVKVVNKQPDGQGWRTGTHVKVHLSRTVLFALFCGPLFWVCGLLFVIFVFIIDLLRVEE